ICCKNNSFVLIAYYGKHLRFGMAVNKYHVQLKGGRKTVISGNRRRKKIQLAAFLHRQNRYIEKACFFPRIRLSSPFPVFFIRPELCIFKGWLISRPVGIPFYRTTAMVEMEMCEENIRNIFAHKTVFF